MSSAPVQKSKRGYSRPISLCDHSTHYCAGCGHGITHRIIGELLDEMNLCEKTIAVAPVGCAVLLYDYLKIDCCESPHGRAPAIATGIKRCHPDKFVFTYQGDGDLAAIGTAETIHAANRGENISVIFINNTVYGMTGGQMAPTTMLEQKTSTCPGGRNREQHGNPIRMSEILATLDGVTYVERVALTGPAGVRKAKNAIRKSFQIQLDGKGYSIVELLSPCPTYLRMHPTKAIEFVEKEITKVFPPGVFKDNTKS